MSFTRLRPPRALGNLRAFGTSSARRQASAPIPYVQSCPSPTCACGATPPGMDIDRKSPLLNTMAGYSEQVVVCTGKDDWTSRVEDEATSSGDFVRGLKGVVGKGGEAFDPFNNIMITASSLPVSARPDTTTALLFPSFKRIQGIPHSAPAYASLAAAYLKPRTLHPMHERLSPTQQANLLRVPSRASEIPPATPITDITILICGHGGRDQRCGILGPILRDGFRKELDRRGVKGDVGLISHIGGHKYAGNVIIYVPPSWEGNALKGSGVWYGRVGPEQVEGIVSETVLGGRVIADLFRGGITQDGGNLGRKLEAQMRKDRGEDEVFRLKPRARAE